VEIVMSNALLAYQFGDNPVRVITLGDAPWFVASDVAAILGYRNAPDMARLLDDDEADTHIVRSSGQPRNMLIISESGLYNAIFRSRRDEARAFRHWVTGEVLPALRRTGHYDCAAAPSAMPGDPAALNASVATVREARHLFGPAAARIVWMKLGLPVPMVENGDALHSDGMAADLRAWLAGVSSCTIDEAAAGIGLVGIDNSTRLRIGALLRMLGWLPRKVRRRGGPPVNLFTPAIIGTAVSVEG
jgi:prophage antirepressor-like protein